MDPGHLGDQFVALALGPAVHGVQGGQVDDGLQAGAHDRREPVGGQGLGLDGLAHVVPAPVCRLLRCGRQGVLGDLFGCPAVSRSAARRRARRRTWRRPRRSLGFEPHPDFAKGAALLGDWEAGTSDVTFGRDGKPFYINGPRDDTYGTLAKLRQAVGDGNFEYLVQFPGPGY